MVSGKCNFKGECGLNVVSVKWGGGGGRVLLGEGGAACTGKHLLMGCLSLGVYVPVALHASQSAGCACVCRSGCARVLCVVTLSSCVLHVL